MLVDLKKYSQNLVNNTPKIIINNKGFIMEKIKISRNDLIEFDKGLKEVKGWKGTKFSYAIIKNIKLISSEIDSIESTRQLMITNKFKEYDKKRSDLIIKYANKDDNGNPILTENNMIIIQNTKEFNSKLEKLTKEYEVVLNEQNKKDLEFNTFLKEKIEIEIYKIGLEFYPENEIDGNIMEKLWLMLIEPDE